MKLGASCLLLSTGERFHGLSPDWMKGAFFGEAVFTTGMVGYVESLTDPSYAGQILSFTYPLIGNYGVPSGEKWESGRIQVAGAIFGNLSETPSHFDQETSLPAWLNGEKIPWITGVDTRALAIRLRKSGATPAAIWLSGSPPRTFPDPNRRHLVREVSPTQPTTHGAGKKRVILVDCGMKEHILRSLLRYPVEVMRVPYDFDYTQEDYDGIFLSNGPGDPKLCKETVQILQKAIKRKKPTMGICLGAQILALAIGGKTYKLKYGHRGQNHGVREERTGRSILTSQNHGFAIEEDSLPRGWRISFRHLKDGSVEGIEHKTLPYFAVQFHPESSPGPTDPKFLFDRFWESL